MRLLNLPLPIFAAALAQPVTPPEMSAPAWVTAFLVGVFVVVYVLNAVGKLPGAGGERREASFREDDRRKLDDVHGVVTREDPDRPGWRLAWHPARETREIRDLLIELSDLREDWESEREEWKSERAAMEDRHVAEREEWKEERSRLDARLVHLEEVNRIQGIALGARGDSA